MTAHGSYDLCVIGAGSGGLSVAAAAAQLGARVVLIEKGKMGGDCLNYGCVPSKALIAAARHAHLMGEGERFGIAAVRPSIDFAKVHAHVHGVIAAIEPMDSQARFEGLGVRVLRTAARFRNREAVEAGGEEIRARRFVIATGSSPAVPPIPGLDQVAYLTNETVFDNKVLPGHLIVIGGGPIGLELAQAHARLGSKVTVLEAVEPLAKDDPELARFVLDQVREDGVEIIVGAKVTEVRRQGANIEAVVAEGNQPRIIQGSHLLLAAGRIPNLDGLNLDAAGIRHSQAGIKVDRGLRTSNWRVYAVGDVAGGPQFTHVANHHAGLVLSNALFRLPAKVNADAIPWVTFTDPSFAHVGLTEAWARERHGRVSVVRWPFAENDRAQAERRIGGLIKVVATRRGAILGASIVGANAGELIGPWALALSQGLKLRAMTGMIVPYPTLGEVNKRVAVSYYAGLAASPWVRRLMRLAKLFG